MAPFTCSVTQIKGTVDEYVDVRAKCEQGFNLDGQIMTFHGAGFFFGRSGRHIVCAFCFYHSESD